MGYLGSKGASGTFQAVIASMRPHDLYIEAFLGSGAVLKAKPPAARSIAIDLDPRAIAAFRAWQVTAEFNHDVELVTGDAIAFLEAFDFKAAGRVLVYLDPPYVLATRTSDKRYRHDFTEADHRRLIACARALPCPAILSGYPSALYDALIGDWRTIEFQGMTRGGPRTEKLWINYAAEEVAWSTYAGSDYIERQRIKRKAANWARMYSACGPGERLALLAALLAAEGGDKV